MSLTFGWQYANMGANVLVLNEAILELFARKHNQAKYALEDWLGTTKQAAWQHLMDVRRNFPAADGKVKKQGYTVFNIRGNNYRLVTLINYKKQIVEVVEVMTHSQYDRWNKL